MEASKEEQRGVVRFLTAEGVEAQEIHRRMSAVSGVSCSRVLEWHKRFRKGCVSLQGNARPGQAHRAVIAEVDGLIRESRRITVEELRRLVGISHGYVHVIATKHLHYKKKKNLTAMVSTSVNGGTKTKWLLH
ncbi:hypothetical protein ANN_24823 [Periplaneta americana]|uniref:Mos1 transposase HTH domain-containing protein n=1 Tax=Periplaneta americana TaxID=6978 RepID=A0ABQ8S0B3_PERAM|nr:hypothetical protein ANN_24823 [Periplaneta americana]